MIHKIQHTNSDNEKQIIQFGIKERHPAMCVQCRHYSIECNERIASYRNFLMLGIACSLEYFPDRNTNYKSNTKIENKSVVQYQHNYRNDYRNGC